MSNLPIFDVAGSAMNAQSVRLSTIASNLANANSVSGNPDEVFRARLPGAEHLVRVAGDGIGVGQVGSDRAQPHRLGVHRRTGDVEDREVAHLGAPVAAVTGR